jgi:hypothetical protein
MLESDQVGRALPAAAWRVRSTDENTEGDGLVMPCQESRYAAKRTTAALVRTFDSRQRKPSQHVTAVQATQASASPRAATRSYDTAVGWFAGCTDDRAQLLATRDVRGVGDEATMVVLRTWDKPVATVVAGVARTGLYTTTTLSRASGLADPSLRDSARLLGDAVSKLCGLPDAGRCVTRPRLRSVAPVPVSKVPGMLAEVDLPPVTGVDRPWVGTEPRKALDNAAATRCDEADFRVRPMSDNVTRTFLIPGAKLPDEFGLTETVGSMPEKDARSFVADVRDKLASCSEKQMGTDVTRVRHVESKHDDLSVWHVSTEISDDVSVTFLMGIVRDRTAIAQVGFVPAPKVGMAAGAFEALVERAGDRLAAMPPPAKRG